MCNPFVLVAKESQQEIPNDGEKGVWLLFTHSPFPIQDTPCSSIQFEPANNCGHIENDSRYYTEALEHPAS